MQQRITLITLGVADLQRARKFYEQVFGWQPTGAHEGVVFFQLNGLQLALFPSEELAKDAGIPDNGHGFRRFSLAYNVRSEQEVDNLVKLLETRGAHVVKQPEKVFWGGYSSYIADPDGNLWEIAYNPFLSLDEAGNAAG